ncbi:hypothetical protein [Bacillus sp. E(2018)]|uniref:hypothetical protein n=1 Tax=Bacillus sp. E(2018) TaxID=2502239 RepID=UPI0010F7AB61|nr:hypothetical protein [Bacillus sp. E(2018)]
MNWNWNETIINLEYSYGYLKLLLNDFCKKKSEYSHYELAKWCDNLTMAWEEEDLDEKGDLTFFIARDIECQWDLYLINTYTDKQLRALDLNTVSMPENWIQNWFQKLNTGVWVEEYISESQLIDEGVSNMRRYLFSIGWALIAIGLFVYWYVTK